VSDPPGRPSNRHDVPSAGCLLQRYHAWAKRRPSRRWETDAVLIAAIRAVHATSRGIYGAPRIHAELMAKGQHIGR
jgi:hypothetical protein